MTTSAGNLPASEDHSAWAYRSDANRGGLDGYHVRAIDGLIGEVIASDDAPDRGYVIVSGDRPIRTVMLPAGLISWVDRQTRVVVVGATLAQIRAAPAFENDRYRDGAYLAELDHYYSSVAAFGQPATG
jgi:hypothetical protein